MHTRQTKIEICTESIDGARAAERGGADRIELCSALSVGGLTPSHGLISGVLRECRLPVMVMVRPREGSFVYSDSEFSTMLSDIRRIRNLVPLGNVEGIVTGLLNTDGTVDEERSRQIVEAAYPLSCTFHRAIDVSVDPLEALETIISCRYDRVLTSGQQRRAPDGVDVIRRMVTQAAGRIIVMAGAGIRPDNVAAVVHHTGVSEIHSSASVQKEDYLSTPMHDPARRQETSAEVVEAILSELSVVAK